MFITGHGERERHTRRAPRDVTFVHRTFLSQDMYLKCYQIDHVILFVPSFSSLAVQGPPTVSITFMPAGKQVTAVAGQSLKDVAQAARIPIKYNCKKGECGTCEVVLNGKKVRTCVGIVPRGARKNEVTIKVPN